MAPGRLLAQLCCCLAVLALGIQAARSHGRPGSSGGSGGGGGSSGSGVGGGNSGGSSGGDSIFVGGPTLVTDQRLGGPLATRGWLAYPAVNRVTVFDGRVLHGE